MFAGGSKLAAAASSFTPPRRTRGRGGGLENQVSGRTRAGTCFRVSAREFADLVQLPINGRMRCERPERACEICGEAFRKRGDARYCSNACKQEAYRRRLPAEPDDDGLIMAPPTLADLENWLSFGRQ